MLFELADIPFPLLQPCTQTPASSRFPTHFFSFVSELIRPPLLCFLILKTILLTCPRHPLPGSPKLVPEAQLEPCRLFFISACCCSSHFSILQKQMNRRCICTLLLKNSFIISHGNVSQWFTMYFWWMSCSYRKPTIWGFCFQQGLEKAQLFGSWAKSRRGGFSSTDTCISVQI